MISGLHHLALITNDLEKCLSFYRDFIGMTEIRRIYREERNSWKIDLKGHGFMLEVFTLPGAPSRPSYPEAAGLRHLALATSNLETLHQAAISKGYMPEGIRLDPHTGKHFFFVADPDELPVEFYEA